jgi:hypothetical protein
MRAILDFDDLCDTNDPYDALVKLHERDSNFKVTLFAIPVRCSEALLHKYSKISDWCQLAVHGWRHSRHEALGWNSEETNDRLQKAQSLYPGFAKLFKAPNWETHNETYAGCKAAGFAIADHIRNIEILPAKQPHYIYNIRLRGDKFTRLHGHIQPWDGTGLTENADESGINPAYLLPVGTDYAFCAEAVTTDKGVAI